MLHQQNPELRSRSERFKKTFPKPLIGFIAVVQMISTFAILGLEILRNIVSLPYANLFVGLWTSIPFTILWISMFCTVCCCQRQNCAAHAAFQNIISFIFACVLIGADIAFLREPSRCFFSDSICRDLSEVYWNKVSTQCFVSNDIERCERLKISLLKGQLAVAVILMVSCLTYLAIFIMVSQNVNEPRKGTSRKVRQPPTQQPYVLASIGYTNNPHAMNPVRAPSVRAPSAPVQVPIEINSVAADDGIPYTPMYPRLSST